MTDAMITTKSGEKIGLHSYITNRALHIDYRGEAAKKLRVGSVIVVDGYFVKLTARVDNRRDPAWRSYAWERTSVKGSLEGVEKLIAIIANAVGGLKPKQVRRLRSELLSYQ